MAATARRLESQFRLPASTGTAVPVLVPPLPVVDFGASEALKALKSERKLTTGAELIEALERKRRCEIVPTAIDSIDALLDGGLPRGKITEIAGRGARLSVAVAAIASATSSGEAAAFIDLGDCFDPQLGESAGIQLYRMLWVRPKTLKQSVAAAEMLVATGFQLVVLDAGLPPLRGRVPDAAWVRLARAAEAHGTALLVSTPYPLTGTTSVAMLRASAARARWRGGLLAGVETTLRLEKHRRKRPGESARIEFQTPEEFAVRGSQFAEPFSVRRSPLADDTIAVRTSLAEPFSVVRSPLADDAIAVRGSQLPVAASGERRTPKTATANAQRRRDSDSANGERGQRRTEHGER